MSPAEIVPGEFCASYFSVYEVRSTDEETWYTIVTDGERGPICNCDGFKYRQDCRHSKLVWKKACMWNCQWHDGNPMPTEGWMRGRCLRETIPGSKCPHCAGPLVPVRIAV